MWKHSEESIPPLGSDVRYTAPSMGARSWDYRSSVCWQMLLVNIVFTGGHG